MKLIIRSYILLFSYTVLYGIPSIEDTYNELKKNPGYRNMSLLEIAISRADSAAISHFEYKATGEDLRRARVLLQKKIAGSTERIEDLKREYLEQPEKADDLETVEEARDSREDFEDLLQEIDHRLAQRTTQLAGQIRRPTRGRPYIPKLKPQPKN